MSASAGADACVPGSDWAGLMPKRPTQAEEFLRKHPEFDGRSVVVAVLDTGCCPVAPGLVDLPGEGGRKFLDFVDVTGSGDVDVSHVAQAAPGGTLTGLSGRSLKLPAEWENPSTRWYLGLKRAYELLPKPVADRVRRMRKRRWEARLEERRTSLRAAILAAAGDVEQKADLETQLKVLNGWATAHEDHGPVFDCVVWDDGQRWLAAIDVSETGDLAGCQPMQDYADAYHVGNLGHESNQSFTVTLRGPPEAGQPPSLTIVSQAGSHGTHVAGIIGAYFPEQPELNGIAPGCHMVSVKIGDSRLGSMETTNAMVRAMRYIADFCRRAPGGRKIDLINLSYGEPAAFSQSGVFVEAVEHLVAQHGVVFVTSAGNDGPALSTIGAPASISSSVIAVGAWLEPEMMRDEYAMAEGGFSERPYSWSSKGPTADGHTGVSVCAPGGAVASVPSATLKKTQLMNGTSMASPNACGAFALLASGLKAARPELKYTPQTLRLAVENTARPCADISVFNQGCGLVQVDAAWDLLSSLPDARAATYAGLRIDVSIVGTGDRGVYIRNPARLREFGGEITASAQLRPKFPKIDSRDPDLTEDDARRLREINAMKLGYDLRLALRATADWVTHPKQLPLLSDGKSFKFTLRTQGLSPGAHYAEIQGFAEDLPRSLGPLCRIPITVIIPEPSQQQQQPQQQAAAEEAEVDQPAGGDCRPGFRFRRQIFEPRSGRQRRWFLEPPAGATWVEVAFRHRGLGEGPLDNARDRVQFMGHLLQMKPLQPYRRHESCKFFGLQPGETHLMSLALEGQQLLEVCLAQYWSSAAGAVVDVEVRFQGVRLEGGGVALGTAPYKQMVAHAGLRTEEVLPAASLKTFRRSLGPKAVSLRPLPDIQRTGFCGDRTVFALQLQYEFTGALSGKLTPRLPLLNGVLYEAVAASQMWMLFDLNRKLLGTGDCYPGSVGVKEGVAYTLRVQVCHPDHDLLDALRNMPVELDYALEKPLTLGVFDSYPGVVRSLAGKAKPIAKKVTLRQGHSMSLFLQGPTEKALREALKGVTAAAGDQLLGQIVLEAGVQANQEGSGKRPSGFPISCVLSAAFAGKPADLPTPKLITVGGGGPEPAPQEERKEEAAEGAPAAAEADGPAKGAEKKAAAEDAEESPETQLRDLQLEHLGKLIPAFVAGLLDRKNAAKDAAKVAYGKPADVARLRELAEAWLPGLLAKWPQHGPLLSLQLRYRSALAFAPSSGLPMDPEAARGQPIDAELLAAVEAASAQLEAIVDHQRLAAHLGLRADPEEDSKARAAEDKLRQQEKQWLVEALAGELTVRGQRLMQLPAAESGGDDAQRQQLSAQWTQTWSRYSRWADPQAHAAPALMLVHWSVKAKAQKGCPGRTLEALEAAVEAAQAKAAGREAWEQEVAPIWRSRENLLRQQLGWTEWADYFENTRITSLPPTFTLF